MNVTVAKLKYKEKYRTCSAISVDQCVCLLLFVCKCRCPIAPSAASTLNKDKSENRVQRRRRRRRQRACMTRGKGFYSKGKYIFWTAFWIQVVFLYCHFKKTYPLIKIIFSFVRLTSLCATFKRKKTVCMIITTKINSITITHRWDFRLTARMYLKYSLFCNDSFH